MRAHNISLPDGETIFVGIDMHQRQWRVTIRTVEVELLSASIPGDWESLRHSLERSKLYVENLSRIRFSTRWQQESFESLLAQYEFFTKQIERQTRLSRSLSQTAEYRERVRILQSIPGVGLIAAMEMLLELQDVARFRRADQLAAYVGLTPAQHSGGDVARMGRITRSGKNSLRGTLVEAAWRMISKDSAMRKQYEQLKARAGAKRAIVAMARRLLLRARRMLLDGRAYVAEPVAA